MSLQLSFSVDIKRKENEMRVTHLHLQLQIFLAECALPHFWYQGLEASGSPLVEVEAKPELSIKIFRNVLGSRLRWFQMFVLLRECHLVWMHQHRQRNARWHRADAMCSRSLKLEFRVTARNCSIKALWCATIISTHQKRESKGSLMRVCCSAPLSRRFPAHSVIMEMECLYL